MRYTYEEDACGEENTMEQLTQESFFIVGCYLNLQQMKTACLDPGIDNATNTITPFTKLVS